jgi:magnesium transporter
MLYVGASTKAKKARKPSHGTIVSIPATLVASIYGMNFKNMRELSWAWGYCLAVIALSALLPILWFKWRKWL